MKRAALPVHSQLHKRPSGIVTTALIFFLAIPAAAQMGDAGIIVNGNPLSTSRPAQQTGGEWFVPLTPIARALGYEVRLVPEISGFRVIRNGGAEAVFDGKTGEIRFGAVIGGQVKNYRLVRVAGPEEELLFPLDGVAVLFGVTIRHDPDRNEIHIDPATDAQSSTPSVPSYSIANMDYAVGLTTNGRQTGHYTMVRGESVAAGIPFSSSFLVSGAGSDVRLRQGFVRANLKDRRTLVAGDQTVYSSVDPLTSSLRGLGYTSMLKGFEAQAYAGRAVGVTHAALGVPGLAAYDTNLIGMDSRKKTKTGEFALSANSFAGSERRGSTTGAAFLTTMAKNQLRLQGAIGVFSGLSSRTITIGDNEMTSKAPVKGFASGFSLLDTLTPFRQLTITAQVDRYGRSFLTAREEPRYNAQLARRLNVAARVIGLNLFGSINDREFLLAGDARLRGYGYGASAPLPHLQVLQWSFFRSVQNDTASTVGRFEMTQFSLVLIDTHHYSANASYSETRFGGSGARNLTFMASKGFGAAGRLGIHDQIQPRSSNRYGFDWQLERPKIPVSFRIGLDRIKNLQSSVTDYSPFINATLRLPGGRHVQLSYSGDRRARTFGVTIDGSLIKHEQTGYDAQGRFTIEPRAVLTGQIYFDADNDGVFKGASDKALSGVPVWLDETVSVGTDPRGFFRFDQVKPGAHSIRADLAAVPADLVFAGNEERTVAVLPYRVNSQDFKAVRTGAVAARVTYMDYSDDPDNPVERPLPDARIIADANHDSYSDLNGNMILGSLPPGMYRLKLDPATLPQGYSPARETWEVQVQPGETVRGVSFRLVVPPKPIIQKNLPKQVSP